MADQAAQALPALKRAAKLAPNNPKVWSHLGIAYDARGSRDKAAKAFEHALRLEPSNSATAYNAARNAIARKRFRQAEDMARQALVHAPRHAELHLILARALRPQIRHQEARQHADRALALKPDSPPALSTLARINEETLRIPEALGQRQRAFELEPHRLARLRPYARLAIREGQAAQAMTALEAYQGERESADYLSIAGYLHEANGDRETAISFYRQACADDALVVNALYTLVELSDTQDEPELEEKCNRALDREGIDDHPDGVWLRLARAKIAWDRGDSDAAFADYDLAAQLRRKQALAAFEQGEGRGTPGAPPSFEAGATRYFDESHLRIQDETLLQAAQAAEPGPTPLFILGLPRSGKTLAETLLGRLDGIGVGAESTEFTRLFRELANHWEPGALGPQDIIDCLARTTPEALSQGLSDCRQRLARFSPSARFITLTLPAYLPWAGLLSQLMPDARFILMDRPVGDLGLSCYAKDFQNAEYIWSTDLAAIGRGVAATEALAEQWLRDLPEQRVTRLSYNDLTQDPNGALSAVIEALSLPLDSNPEAALADLSGLSSPPRSFADTPAAKTRPSTAFLDIAAPFQAHLGPLYQAYEAQRSKLGGSN